MTTIVGARIAAVALALAAASSVDIEAPSFLATFERGALSALTDERGTVFVGDAATVRGGGLMLLDRDRWARKTTVIQPFTPKTGAQEAFIFPEDASDARMAMTYTVDQSTGDLLITQRGEAPDGGISAIRWSIERIPLSWRLIVPGRSGIRLTADTPGDTFTLDYPMTWEAQLLIVEGDDYGFYVWADDPEGRFKRLVIDRDDDGWRIGFDTHPLAPYEDKTVCRSVVWRLNVYEGDWRVPARRYRDWMKENFAPVPLEKQQLEWARDIRACIVMPMDADMLTPLARELDPSQTLIYIYDWRAAGYDRNYPDYDNVYDAFPPFMEKAKGLGFRVMLHVNYFGCDPEHPLYEDFEPYHCRVPHGQNNKDWWHYPVANPPIKFAYINPASAAWRRELVERFTRLCETYNVDALHLDQTLVIYNDYNGLIDGKTMLEGNIALHRELREALPQVALSGEGLNEVTYRHEAFAQLHVHGIHHAENTFKPSAVDMAHPINAYLFRPYTITYGYLGIAPPTQTRLFAAWLEAYRRWGVIPTLKPADLASLKTPTGFTRLLLDEMRCWMDLRLVPDMDAAWPPDVAFPLRTASGERATYTRDRALTAQGQEKQRIISGERAIALPGTIPGWRGYTETRLIGLDPDARYPYTPAPRALDTLRVSALPDGYTLTGFYESDTLACFFTRPLIGADIRLPALLDNAFCGSRPVAGDAYEQRGPLLGPDGAQFTAHGDALYAHPPWHVPGSGEAYARFHLALPDTARLFTSNVTLNPFAVGDAGSDGVLFSVSLRAEDGREARQEVFTDTARHTPLELDLREFAGRQVALELSVSPGPAGNPSHDWARWHEPRIICDVARAGMITLDGVMGWRYAISAETIKTLSPEQDQATLHARFPGAVYLLRERPPTRGLPFDLTALPFETAYHLEGGVTRDAPQHACAQAATNTVGGVTKPGFFTHPPNQGATSIHFPLTLDKAPARFHSYVGLRDGADDSTGVLFRVEVNGASVTERFALAGNWQEIEVDLSPWSGQPVVLSLAADAAGDYICDWACWGMPGIME